MKVVAGEFGGRPLKTLDGQLTRPTSDKVKGAIFSMLGQFFDEGRVLDLYAGSGSLSIEAISRGCDSAILVEKDRRAQKIIEVNVQMTRSEEQFELFKMSADKAISLLTGEFDLVFLDPPYAKEQVVKDILLLNSRRLLAKTAVIVCETDKTVQLPDEIDDFYLSKQKRYGISQVTIYERK
ncbi:MAG: 16S rRNA (guanine(966)-N(2))-methyltransferase RsmD [Streptococcaceae bacterium]|jgi:16S rRNA (guanine(966)-N(2))-methyltransferase RsmD|nr:16S rRNA (guanine(966)-N(2))-methyltransferase RsmD [Streptococcaceae bacterium]